MPDWFNQSEAADQVPTSDRGFQYGDGLFETIAIREGEPRLWGYHVDRLARGCRVLGIRMPSENELYEGLCHALQRSEIPADRAGVKVIVSAGSGLRGYARPFVESPTVLYHPFSAASVAPDFYRSGIEAVICETRLASGSAAAGLKTLNRLEQVLARSELVGTDSFEGLTLDAEDNIICGTMSNVFFVNNNSVSTSPLDRCGVEGVMRRHVIETLDRQGIVVDIQACSLPHLADTDEVFLSNSQFGVIPVRACGKIEWPVGQVTRNVMTIMAGHQVPECRL